MKRQICLVFALAAVIALGASYPAMSVDKSSSSSHISKKVAATKSKKSSAKPVHKTSAKKSSAKASAKPQAAKSSKPASEPKNDSSKAAPKSLPRLIDLGSDKCIPCKMMAPILDELKNEYKGKVKVEFINVRTDPDSAEQYGIQSIPTQIFFDAKGKEVYRHAGFMPKDDIEAKLKDMGVKKQ